VTDGASRAAEAPASGTQSFRETEAETARRAFHRALQADASGEGATDPETARRQRRSAALQVFFVANTGRGLLPGAETSGSLSPQLKDEEP
jgi:type IV secretion system protein TrbL